MTGSNVTCTPPGLDSGFPCTSGTGGQSNHRGCFPQHDEREWWYRLHGGGQFSGGDDR